MFVTRPMMATRPWATNPVATARTIAQPEMTTTRLSTVERSSGTRAASNVGASEGATGTPSVEAPPSRSGSVNSPLLLRPHVIFEQHRRASLGADGDEDLAERVRKLLPLRSEEHTSELQSPCNLVCRLLLEKKNKTISPPTAHWPSS